MVKTKPIIRIRKSGQVTSRNSSTKPATAGFVHFNFWNLYKHGLTYSAIDRWLTCKEQFRIIYVEGYNSRDVSPAIEYGSCVHWVLEQVYKRARTGNTERPTPKEIEALVNEYEQHWLEQVTAPTQTQLEQQQLVYGMAESVLPSYFRRWDGDLTGKYTHQLDGIWAPKKWIKLEEVFCYPYKMPDGRIIPLRGKKDGTFLNERDELFIFDTKCKGQVNEEAIANLITADFQTMLYMYCEQQNKPRGAQLNIVRRPQLRRGKNESLPEFLKRIKDDAATIERFDFYFTRIQSVVTRDELQHWHDTRLAPTLLAIQQWYHGTAPHYPTDKALSAYNKTSELTGMVIHGDTTGLYKRNVVFPELPDIQF